MRPKYPAETTNFSGHPKWQCDRSILNAKTKNEFVFRFSYFTFENEKPKTNSFFVFLTLLLKTKNEKGIRFSFFVRKFENEKRKNGIYTDPGGHRHQPSSGQALGLTPFLTGKHGALYDYEVFSMLMV